MINYDTQLPAGFRQQDLRDQLMIDQAKVDLLNMCDKHNVSEDSMLLLLEEIPTDAVELSYIINDNDGVILNSEDAYTIFGQLEQCLADI